MDWNQAIYSHGFDIILWEYSNINTKTFDVQSNAYLFRMIKHHIFAHSENLKNNKMIYCIEILRESVYQSVKFYIIDDNPIKVCDLVIDFKSSKLSNTNNVFFNIRF